MTIKAYTDLDGALKIRIHDGDRGAIITLHPSSLATLPKILDEGNYAEFSLDLSNVCYIRRTKPYDIVEVGAPTTITETIGA